MAVNNDLKRLAEGRGWLRDLRCVGRRFFQMVLCRFLPSSIPASCFLKQTKGPDRREPEGYGAMNVSPMEHERSKELPLGSRSPIPVRRVRAPATDSHPATPILRWRTLRGDSCHPAPRSPPSCHPGPLSPPSPALSLSHCPPAVAVVQVLMRVRQLNLGVCMSTFTHLLHSPAVIAVAPHMYMPQLTLVTPSHVLASLS